MAWGVTERSRMLLAHSLGTVIALAPLTAQADPALLERSPLSLVLFGSLEAGSAKTYGSAGLKYALGGAGLDASGFRLGLKWGQSTEPAQRRPSQGQLLKSEIGALLGYEWRIGETFLAVSVGAESETAYREWRDPRGLAQRTGPRLQVDLWARPHADWLIQANAYAVGADGGRVWGRLAPGWRLAQELYLGPEVEAYRERRYHKLRLGLHLTGIELLGVTWRLAAGLQRTSVERSEAYVTLGFYWKR